MSLRPIGRRHPKAGALSPQKIRALRAFTNWMRALEENPRQKLASFAREQGVTSKTVWRYVHATPSVAETFVSGVMRSAQQGLAMAIQRGIEDLSREPVEGEEGEVVETVSTTDALRWAEFFAKYVHGNFTKGAPGEAGGSGVNVTINVGAPAHVRARLGLEGEELKQVDAKLVDVKELLDE